MAARGITRRGFLASTGAMGAAALAPGAPATPARGGAGGRARDATVAVVGAGLSGLYAARQLVKAGVSSVVVLEARDRVGGRTFSGNVEGVALDLGGQWIKTRQNTFGEPHHRMMGLASEFGIETFMTYYEGENVYYREGERTTYTPSSTSDAPQDEFVVEMMAAGAKLDYMAIGRPGAGNPKIGPGVSTDAPWESERAEEFDGQTLETWKLENIKLERNRKLFDTGMAVVFAAEPRDLSLLYALYHFAQADSVENTIGLLIGENESRFVGGSQQISKKLAASLGDRVVLGAPVRRIVQENGAARVEADGAVVHAKRVIVATAPAVAGRIEYEPAIPGARRQLTQRTPLGSAIKCQAIYPEPFWRADGLTGFALSDVGPIRVSADNSPKDGSPGVLVGFILGQHARDASKQPDADRRRAVLESFARFFGSRALDPSGYSEMNWLSERYSAGCYGHFTAPGVLLGYRETLHEPVGVVHWASSEVARKYTGHMEGALAAGEHAASEVLERL